MPSSVGKLVALLLLPALTACETAGSPAKGEVTEASGARAEPARFTSDDQRLMSRTRHLALERAHDGEPRQWVNEISGNSGVVTPVGTYNHGGGMTCRDFRESLTVGGQATSATQTACKDAEGRWTAGG